MSHITLNDLTIVIPTYNRNEYLLKILNTIPANVNVIVCDNGGSVTNEIINRYKEFSFIRPDRALEMFENWNFAISKVKTKWFIIPSDDDIYYAGAFEKIASVINENGDTDVILFGHNIINEFDAVLSTWAPSHFQVLKAPEGYDYFKYGVEARLPSVIFKTDVATSYSLFKETYIYTAADSLLIQKMMLHGKTVLVPDVISGYRVWPNNFTSKLISTSGWLEKIDQWQDEIAVHVNEVYKTKYNTLHIKDEVYARNLIAGIINMKAKHGFGPTYTFFKSVRFPWNAKMVTKLNVIKALFV